MRRRVDTRQQVVCTLLLAARGIAAAALLPARVQTDGGWVKGVVDAGNGTRRFRGIPFAAPPLKDLRFQPPQPAASWKGDLDASKFGADCQQLGPAWDSLGNAQVANSSEDCLFLNVYTPASATDHGPLPVLFYIPAGGYTWGAGNDQESNDLPGIGTASAGGPPSIPEALRVPLILVTINYRLGPLGFLAGKQLSATTKDGTSGYFGLQDQRAALQWVQRNIEAFGGDKNNVALWGESAGASSVTYHLVLEKSWGLFSKAIIESGAFNTWTVQTLEKSQATFDALVLDTLKCNTSKLGVPGCLRAEVANDLLMWTDSTYGHGGYLPNADSFDYCQWAPPVDGIELKASPLELLRAGKVAPGVQVLLGTNANEGTYWGAQQLAPQRHHHGRRRLQGPPPPPTTYAMRDQQWKQWLNESYSEHMVEPLHELYSPPNSSDPDSLDWYYASAYTIGDSVMTCAARTAARYLHEHGHKVYVYFFAHTPRTSINFPSDYIQKYMGAFHGAELPFIFFDKVEINSTAEHDLATTMITYWSNFAWTGDPNSGPKRANLSHGLASTHWPPYTHAVDGSAPQGDSVIKLDISPPPAPNGVASLRRRAQDPLPPPGKLNISVVQGLKQQVCDFWSSSAAKYSHQSVPVPDACSLDFSFENKLCLNGTIIANLSTTPGNSVFTLGCKSCLKAKGCVGFGQISDGSHGSHGFGGQWVLFGPPLLKVPFQSGRCPEGFQIGRMAPPPKPPQQPLA